MRPEESLFYSADPNKPNFYILGTGVAEVELSDWQNALVDGYLQALLL
jgi:hypothetical protein